MIDLFLITNQPDIAIFAVKHGVSHIFVDLEIIGKHARQGHLDTLISKHTIQDVQAIRTELDGVRHAHKAELLVRINPWSENSENEIESVIESGADWIMLPMYRTAAEVGNFCAAVAGRARCIPLIETLGACECLEEVAAMPEVDKLFIGLNDLHIEMRRTFMFELLADGTVERMANVIKKYGKPFGFGGIARIGEGMVTAEHILGEHVRLSSSAVILSRTFHRHSQSIDDLHANLDFGKEIEKLRLSEQLISKWSQELFQDNKQALVNATGKVVLKMRELREKNL